MEPNDNGPRPDSNPDSNPTPDFRGDWIAEEWEVKRKRRNYIATAAIAVVAVVALIVPLLLAVAVFSARTFYTTENTIETRLLESERRIMAEVLTDEVLTDEVLTGIHDTVTVTILEEMPHLSVIDSVGYLGTRDVRLAPDDISQLNISIRSGSLWIINHDEEVIRIRSTGSSRYEFDSHLGILDINGRSETINIYVPSNQLDPVFENVNIEARSGSVGIQGSAGDNVFIAENLNIGVRSGGVTLSNITVSGQMNVDTRSGNIRLTNVIADAERLNINSRSGSVFVSE